MNDYTVMKYQITISIVMYGPNIFYLIIMLLNKKNISDFLDGKNKSVKVDALTKS